MEEVPTPNKRWEGGALEDYDFSGIGSSLDIGSLQDFFSLDTEPTPVGDGSVITADAAPDVAAAARAAIEAAGTASNSTASDSAERKSERERKLDNDEVSSLIGRRVELIGLARSELNGEEGFASSFNAGRARIGVRLDDERIVWVRLFNVKLAPPRPVSEASVPAAVPSGASPSTTLAAGDEDEDMEARVLARMCAAVNGDIGHKRKKLLKLLEDKDIWELRALGDFLHDEQGFYLARWGLGAGTCDVGARGR